MSECLLSWGVWAEDNYCIFCGGEGLPVWGSPALLFSTYTILKYIILRSGIYL